MANQNTPYGLVPTNQAYGKQVAFVGRPYVVPANQTHALYLGDPVTRVTGNGHNGLTAVDLATAGANAVITGTITGFLGVTEANATTIPSMYNFQASPGPVFRPSTTSQDYYVLVADDAELQLSVQVTGNSTIAQSDYGKNFNLVSGTGNRISGSGWTISATPVTDGAGTGQVTVLGLDTLALNNDSTAAYAKVAVRLNSSTEVNGSTGI